MALEGKELLAAVKQMTKDGLTKSAVAKACGYLRVVKEGDRAGSTTPDVQAFSAALLAAQGFEFGDGGRMSSPRGIVTKTKANLLIVGNPYHSDAQPGQRYKVILEDDGVIVLEPLSSNGNGATAPAAQEPVAV